jgi:pimeloyl-ACP methyl ester carboxylesterase
VYTIEQMACDVIALLDHLDLPRAHLLGHSMGGRIALEAALDWPGRVQSLILAATGSGAAGRPGPDCLPGMPFRIVHGLAEQGFEAYVRHEVVESSAYFSESFRATHGDFVRAFFERDVWLHHARLPEYVRLVMARQYWEATHRLGDVRVPSLVLVGDQDTHGSDHVQQSKVLAARIPGAVYQELAGQSHGYFWEAPEESARVVVEWLARERSPRPTA